MNINNDTFNNGLNEIKEVINYLKQMNINEKYYNIDLSIARGLDYYTDTVFEFIIDSKDELNGLAVVAGGKYANMINSMCGVDVPGIGFALGVERLKAIADQVGYKWNCANDLQSVVIMALDEESKLDSMQVAAYLRDNNIPIEMDYNSISMKAQFKLAERVNAKYIIIIGEEERNTKIYSVKNTENRRQEKVKLEDLVKYIRG